MKIITELEMQDILKIFNKKTVLENIKLQDKRGVNLLMYAILYNKSLSLGLDNQKFDFLIKNSDLKQIINFGWTVLMMAAENNLKEDINLTEDQWDYLIKNSDLSQKIKDNTFLNFSEDGSILKKLKGSKAVNALMYISSYNKKSSINLNEQMWSYLIKNSNLKQMDRYNNNALSYILDNGKIENIRFSDELWEYLIDNSLLSNGPLVLPLQIIMMQTAVGDLYLTEKIWEKLINQTKILNIQIAGEIMSSIDTKNHGVIISKILAKIEENYDVNKVFEVVKQIFNRGMDFIPNKISKEFISSYLDKKRNQ